MGKNRRLSRQRTREGTTATRAKADRRPRGLADRRGQRFHDSRIQENVLPIWFDHIATHDPGAWVTHTVPGML